MVKKSKGRQKIEMVKMKNESNLQVTFSKRRSGLFKKASELCTLCGAEIAIIVFSPGRKVFSFGHPNVEAVIERVLNNNLPPSHQPNNMQLSEVHRNSFIHDMNNHLTQVMNQLESEKKKNEELKKIRESSKMHVNWWEEPIEGLGLAQAYEFKGKLENLKRTVTFEASKFFQATIPHQNIYVGSSSNDPFGVLGSNNINTDLEQFNQRRTVNMNTFCNHDMILPNHPLPFGNNNHGSTAHGFVPEFNVNYIPDYNRNENMSFREENISENEQHHDGHPPHSRSDYY